ncbi:MAG: hypothetical protein HUU23_08725 [Caldilineales bacterium]|nr:hypothetical protein [Caldilineales bacterium]
MHKAALSFISILLFTLLSLIITPAASQAQEICASEAVFVDRNAGQDLPTCGPEDQPCRTLGFALDRIAACTQPLQIWDSASGEILYSANVETPLDRSQVLGGLIGLIVGVALGYFWRKSKAAAAAAALLILAALWLALGQTGPTSAQGSCPGARVYFRATGADAPACAAQGNPCKTLGYARQRAQQCPHEVRIYRKRLIGWKLVEIYRPLVGAAGNQPCDEGWAGLPCRLKSFLMQTEEALEPSLPVLAGLLCGLPIGILWQRRRGKRG